MFWRGIIELRLGMKTGFIGIRYESNYRAYIVYSDFGDNVSRYSCFTDKPIYYYCNNL